MKTYLAYTEELQGLRDVSETVKAVERISASRIHALRRDVAALDRYVCEAAQLLARISRYYVPRDHPLLRAGAGKDAAIVLLTSDTGLVGGLWHSLVGELSEHGPYQSVMVCGAKGAAYLREERVAIAQSFPQMPDILTDGRAGDAADDATAHLFESFIAGAFSRVDILYPRFLSLGLQKPTIVPFLPFDFRAALAENAARPASSKTEPLGLPIFEPSKAILFDRLLRKYMAVHFRRLVAEMKLSELAARTLAMENASEKTDGMIRALTLNFTKERHRFSTQKQLESFAAHQAR